MPDLKPDIQSQQNLTFRLLVGYRWISLLPPLIWLVSFSDPAQATIEGGALILAAGLTLLLTLTATTINHLLRRHPWLLLFDLLLSALLVWYTGAERSPYYLYSLAPILAAAFFFRIPGGLVAATIYAGCYLVAVQLFRSIIATVDSLTVIGQTISFFLIGGIFGYPMVLLQRLRQTNIELAVKHQELARHNRDLNIFQEISLVMQSSADPAELQEAILQGLIQEMGYSRAMIGLYDEHLQALTRWITLAEDDDKNQDSQMRHTDVVPLQNEVGLLAQALQEAAMIEVVNNEAPTSSATLNEQLALGPHYLIFPLSLRGHSIGVILIDRLPGEEQLSANDRRSLEQLATQAGVALGSMRLCIDRAQQVAVSEERNRIALDLHDNVSQALYGTAYGLEACLQLSSHEPTVTDMLTKLHSTVAAAQTQMRKSIFDMRPAHEVTAETYAAGLHRHLHTVQPLRNVTLRIDLPSDFDTWAALSRRQLYRVTQEAVMNTAKHANAQQIVVKLSHDSQTIELRIADDGEGFEPAEIDYTHHLGMQSMSDRIESLNGTFEVNSAFGEGTLIIAKVPYLVAKPAEVAVNNGQTLAVEPS